MCDQSDDQALDMLDKILDDCSVKGKKKQERHFQSNVRVLNANLAVLARAGDALLVARRGGFDPFDAVFDTLEVHAVRGRDPVLEAIDYAQRLNVRGRRVTTGRSRPGGKLAAYPRQNQIAAHGTKSAN